MTNGPSCDGAADSPPTAGVHNSAVGLDLSFHAAGSNSSMRTAENEPTLDPLTGGVRERVIRSGRARCRPVDGTERDVLYRPGSCKIVGSGLCAIRGM